MKHISALLAALMLQGCATVNTDQVKDWPKLEIRHHTLSFFEIQGKCWKHMPFYYKILGSFAFGCAEVDLDKKTCDIYLMKDALPEHREHEEEHCRGEDHDGMLQSYFDGWKLTKGESK